MRKTAGLVASIALLAGSVSPQAALAQDARRGRDDKKDAAAAAVVGVAILGRASPSPPSTARSTGTISIGTPAITASP